MPNSRQLSFLFVWVAMAAVFFTGILHAKPKKPLKPPNPFDTIFKLQDPLVYSAKRSNQLFKICQARKIVYLFNYNDEDKHFVRMAGQEHTFESTAEILSFLKDLPALRAKVAIYHRSNYAGLNKLRRSVINWQARYSQQVDISIKAIDDANLEELSAVFTYFEMKEDHPIYIVAPGMFKLFGKEGLVELSKRLHNLYHTDDKGAGKSLANKPEDQITLSRIFRIGLRQLHHPFQILVLAFSLFGLVQYAHDRRRLFRVFCFFSIGLVGSSIISAISIFSLYRHLSLLPTGAMRISLGILLILTALWLYLREAWVWNTFNKWRWMDFFGKRYYRWGVVYAAGIFCGVFLTAGDLAGLLTLTRSLAHHGANYSLLCIYASMGAIPLFVTALIFYLVTHFYKLDRGEKSTYFWDEMRIRTLHWMAGFLAVAGVLSFL